jgi:hypothetical protein
MATKYITTVWARRVCRDSPYLVLHVRADGAFRLIPARGRRGSCNMERDYAFEVRYISTDPDSREVEAGRGHWRRSARLPPRMARLPLSQVEPLSPGNPSWKGVGAALGPEWLRQPKTSFAGKLPCSIQSDYDEPKQTTLLCPG